MIKPWMKRLPIRLFGYAGAVVLAAFVLLLLAHLLQKYVPRSITNNNSNTTIQQTCPAPRSTPTSSAAAQLHTTPPVVTPAQTPRALPSPKAPAVTVPATPAAPTLLQRLINPFLGMFRLLSVGISNLL